MAGGWCCACCVNSYVPDPCLRVVSEAVLSWLLSNVCLNVEAVRGLLRAANEPHGPAPAEVVMPVEGESEEEESSVAHAVYDLLEHVRDAAMDHVRTQGEAEKVPQLTVGVDLHTRRPRGDERASRELEGASDGRISLPRTLAPPVPQ
jgi:hypothetical protein